MILREMLVDDLDQVMEIEEELFSVPWTGSWDIAVFLRCWMRGM